MAEDVPMLPTWYRAFAIVFGALSISLALIVLIDPYLAVWMLILLLALGLLFMGMDRLAVGISGRPMTHVVGIVPMEEARAAMAGSGPSSPPPSQ